MGTLLWFIFQFRKNGTNLQVDILGSNFNLCFCFLNWRCLTKGMNAIVEIQTQRPVSLELYKDYKELGRFMLRYGGSTIAAGVVTEVTHR